MNTTNTSKLLSQLNEWVESNQKTIDEDMDGDNACSSEIETLENVISLLRSGKCDSDLTVGGFMAGDVASSAEGMGHNLSDEQVDKVLQRMDKVFDANVGMCWDIIEDCIKDIIEESN